MFTERYIAPLATVKTIMSIPPPHYPHPAPLGYIDRRQNV
jgi:hypothetical protein